MDDAKLAELRAQYPYVVPMKRDGKIVAVFRNITFDELLPLYGAGRNPAVNESAIAETCLLWPDKSAFHALRAELPAIVEAATRAIRSISGGQCVVDHDENAKTWSAFVEPKEGDRRHLLSVRKLEWPAYTRVRGELNKEGASQLTAFRLACIEAGFDPKDREARKDVFNDLPYLAVTMFAFIYSLTGGGEFDIEGN